MRVYLNGRRLRSKKEFTPFVRRIVKRIEWRQRYMWLLALLALPTLAEAKIQLATGVFVLMMGNTVFNPVLRIYTTGTSATETIPDRAFNVTIEAWGGGSGGAGGTGVGCAANTGTGGAAGGYSRTAMSTNGQVGHTFVYTVGAGGAGANPSPSTAGGTTTVSPGTVTGFSTMTANGGAAETNAGGAAGGTASGGTQANTTGANGPAAHDATGAAGTNGTVSGDGSPYGAGGAGGALGAGHAGATGQTGAVVFSYTG
jgi:hypothetical protein